ncbi:hypothetical protein OW495_09000 [Vibrio sp. 14N.309.X.WAT.E.F5]|uniref:hypothetical protein n=1 Tax=Vibrio TaxID=662 RepID=UPI000A618807|nr:MULTISPECIES: hypothetical protein [Vibrio]MCC4794719.1 hypothetical protein [Vibrio lentus]MCC4853716.1 hypothetical protein [Vibrio lentus]MDN2666852.1 hypothetical protein [Vibrio sp. 14N.309.X.WAT.E.F5]UPR34710.1 hypothetical protein ISX50_01260 [Vibrio cyclitrophicus]UPR48529.1 hypothetical protein ITG13_04895 [Vibrio cyclitrophicus]
MFKIFALAFIGIGIYLGLNYSDEIESIMDTDAFERVQEKAEDGTDALMDKIDEIKG